MLQPIDKKQRTQSLLADNAGVSFIDLMLATVVLTFGVLALANLQVLSSKSSTSSKGTAAALTVAETKLEQLKDSVFTSIVAEAPQAVTDAASGLTFTRQVTVTNDTPIAGAKTVTVIVSWSDTAGSHRIPVATVIAAPDL
ncbi:MAG: hypothetical protein EPO02_04680 [Nitrospirae bacterium]|nr:MAG: hypothetical protein EPO02_04680 [Nitrospirota bacterium]